MILQRQIIIRWITIKKMVIEYISTEDKAAICYKIALRLINHWEKKYKTKIDLEFGLPHYALASELDKMFRYHLELHSKNQFILDDTIIFKQFVQPVTENNIKGLYKEIGEIDEDDYKNTDSIDYFKKQTIEIGAEAKEK